MMEKQTWGDKELHQGQGERLTLETEDTFSFSAGGKEERVGTDTCLHVGVSNWGSSLLIALIFWA